MDRAEPRHGFPRRPGQILGATAAAATAFSGLLPLRAGRVHAGVACAEK
jgi:hypothetical protein